MMDRQERKKREKERNEEETLKGSPVDSGVRSRFSVFSGWLFLDHGNIVELGQECR